MSTPVALVVAVALLVANGFFVAAEFALLASRRSRLEQMAADGDRGARMASRALRRLSLMLAGAQLGITMASLGLGAVAEPAVAHLIEDGLHALGVPENWLHPIAFAIALSIVVFLHMVVGEMAPKSWAISAPERSARWLARPFLAFVLLFRPVLVVLNAMANGVVRLCGVEPQDERALVHSPGDLALLLDESISEGTMLRDQTALLTGAIELSGLQASDAMTHRPDVVAVAAGDGVAQIEAAFTRSGRRRVLVQGSSMDEVVGVVHARDVLQLDDLRRSAMTARSLARPVLVTYESRALEDLLLDMRAGHNRFAVVVDELGAMTGVVTLSAVLDTLIGRPPEPAAG